MTAVRFILLLLFLRGEGATAAEEHIDSKSVDLQAKAIKSDSACVSDDKSGQMGGPLFDACYRLCQTQKITNEQKSSQLVRRVLVPEQNVTSHLLTHIQAAHAESNDPRQIERGIKRRLSASAKAYAAYEVYAQNELAKIEAPLAKLNTQISAMEAKMKASGLYPSRVYYPGIHPVDPKELSRLYSQRSALLGRRKDLEGKRIINKREENALYNLLKGLDPSLNTSKTLSDAVLILKLESLGNSKTVDTAATGEDNTYFVQIGPTGLALTSLANGSLDRIDLREANGKKYLLACDVQGTNAVSSWEVPLDVPCTASSAIASLLASTPNINLDEKTWDKLKAETQANVDEGLEYKMVELDYIENSALESILTEDWKSRRGNMFERQSHAFIRQMEKNKKIPAAVQKVFDEWDPKSKESWSSSGWPDKESIYAAAAAATDRLEEEAKSKYVSDMMRELSNGKTLSPSLKEAFDKEYSRRFDNETVFANGLNNESAQDYEKQVKFLEVLKQGEKTRTVPRDAYYDFLKTENLYLGFRSDRDGRYVLRADADGRQFLEIIPAQLIGIGACDGGGATCRPVSSVALARFEISKDEARALKKWIGSENYENRDERGGNDDFPLKGSRMLEFCRSLGVAPQIFQQELVKESKVEALYKAFYEDRQRDVERLKEELGIEY